MWTSEFGSGSGCAFRPLSGAASLTALNAVRALRAKDYIRTQAKRPLKLASDSQLAPQTQKTLAYSQGSPPRYTQFDKPPAAENSTTSDVI